MSTLETMVKESVVSTADAQSGVREWLYRHCVNATSFLAAVTPVYTAMHYSIGVPAETSEINRAMTIGLAYGGLVPIYKWGLGRWRATCKVEKKTSGFERFMGYISSDVGYAMAFNGVLAPMMFLIGGERDGKRLVIETLTQMLLSVPAGWLSGYAMDIGPELMGGERSKRWMPVRIREGSAHTKRGVAAMAIVASAALTVGLYMLPGWHAETNVNPIATPMTVEHDGLRK